eukprot:scaffold223_cov408-Prasinococcus_capsulatus_cf.AAC.14
MVAREQQALQRGTSNKQSAMDKLTEELSSARDQVASTRQENDALLRQLEDMEIRHAKEMQQQLDKAVIEGEQAVANAKRASTVEVGRPRRIRHAGCASVASRPYHVSHHRFECEISVSKSLRTPWTVSTMQ